MEQRRRDILAAVEGADQGQGVVLITDMFGGTPSNLAISMLERGRVEVIAGVNLPMLVALARAREDGLQVAVERASEAGREGIAELAQGAAGGGGAGPIGVLVIGHGRLASDFRSATEHVVGPQPGLRAVGVADGRASRRTHSAVEAAFDACEAGRGVIVAADAADGPSVDLALEMGRRPGARVVGGVNLPMLIKLASVRDQVPLAEAAASAVEAGRKYVSVASALLAVDRS
jgi:PTS system mannose-specific IIA component